MHGEQSDCVPANQNRRYNKHVPRSSLYRLILLIILLVGYLRPAANAPAGQAQSDDDSQPEVNAYDLITAMNTLRMSYGLSPLAEDPIIDAVAQSTAEIMAANQMSWHIGDVAGRLAAAGYGGGMKVWATENFAVGGNMALDEIMVVWSDASHMIPAVNPAYCNIGAGVAKSASGMTYYVLQAAYTSGKSCGEYKPPAGFTPQPGGGGSIVSQLIVPVKIATADADGKVFHIVEAGQSFWAIAVAYKITIKDLEIWNNLSKDLKLQIGQRLFIPGPNTKGYATPTPVGMILVSKPDPDGKIVHVVQSYQTLSTISQAYGVKIDLILVLNGLQEDWPLQIGQKLLIHPTNVTPSPTPRPLTPLQKLTPASDGNYYHTIQSGETLSWIAGLYEVFLNDLMSWNGLGEASIIQPGQKLLLQVTPPATATWTPAPPTVTPTATPVPPTLSPTLLVAQPAISPTPTEVTTVMNANNGLIWVGVIGLLTGGLLLVYIFSRKKT